MQLFVNRGSCSGAFPFVSTSWPSRRRAGFRLSCIFGMVLAMFLFGPQCFSEEDAAESTDNAAGLVELCADLHRVNLSPIETWIGRASVSRRTYEDEILVLATESEVEFWCRPLSGELVSKYEIVKREMVDESARPDYVKPDYQGSRVAIVSSDRFIETTRRVGPSNNPPSSYIRPLRDLRALSGPLGDIINPMSFFRASGSEPLYERFLHIKSYIEDGIGWVVTRSGDTVTVSYGDDVGYNEYTIDLSQGGVLKRYTGNGLGRVTNYDIDYELQSGVFLPVRWKFRNAKYVDAGDGFDYDGTPQHVSERTVELQESRLNEPIDDEMFSIANAGIRDGEWVGDLINGGGFYFSSSVQENAKDATAN